MVGLAGIGAGAYLDPGRFGVDAGLSESVPAGRWPMPGRTPQRSGYQPTSDGPTTEPTAAWQQTATSNGPTSLVASEDTVFLSADTVVAYAAEDGRRRWSRSLLKTHVPQGLALWEDTLYVTLDDRDDCDPFEDGSCDADALYALDAATGEVRWARTGIESVTLVAGATVLCETKSISATVGLDARTGAKEWQQPVSRRVAVVDGVLVGEIAYSVTGINPRSGQEVWQQANRPVTDITAHEGIVYATDQEVVTAFDTATETLQWSVERSFEHIVRIRTDGEKVYLSRTSGTLDPGEIRLLALNAETGDELWNRRIKRAGDAEPVVTESALYVPVQGGLLVLDPESGEELGSSRPAGETVPWNVIAAGGQVYSITQNEDQVTLYAHR